MFRRDVIVNKELMMEILSSCSVMNLHAELIICVSFMRTLRVLSPAMRIAPTKRLRRRN